MASGFESMYVCVCVWVREHNHILHGNRNMILHEMGKLAGIFRYICRVFDDQSRNAEDKSTQKGERGSEKRRA